MVKNRKDKEKREFNIEKWVLKIQSKFAFFLSIIFIGLILYMMFGDKERANSLILTFLPIVTGWLGVILGFYFSREISNFLEQKLGKRLKEEDNTLEEYEKTIKEIEKEREEERKQFQRIITSRQSLINDLRNKVHKLLMEKQENGKR